MQATLSEKLAKLKLQINLDLKGSDLEKLADLGQGNGGSVEKVKHVPTGTIMAKKSVLIDAKSSVRKQILRELDIMHECNSEYIISCYGSFIEDPNVCTCIEFMDKGSFDGIYKSYGALPVEVVGRVAMSVLEGLTYLYDVHRIIHRDIKPSNILFNSEGQIKLCDFGVSGELINSIAHTFVGTSVYMSPERIQGADYSVKSDVWSLGISLIELALGAFPFTDPPDDDDLSDLEEYAGNQQKTPTHRDSFVVSHKTAKRASKRRSKLEFQPDGGLTTMSIIELMHQIVQEPSPRLPEGKFPKEAEELVDACLLKRPEDREAPKSLLYDLGTVEQAAALFELIGAKSLLIAGRTRTALMKPSQCIIPKGSQPYYVTDPAHNNLEPFFDAAVAIYEWQHAQSTGCPSSSCAFIQMHGKGLRTCPSDQVFMSSGLRNNPWYTSSTEYPIKRLKRNLQHALPPNWTISLPSDSKCGLTATTNVVGRYTNGIPETKVCSSSPAPSQVTGEFIHIEQAPSSRSREVYELWARALRATFEPTHFSVPLALDPSMSMN
ncbi:hypothetical protein EST38_g3742 [Candolleomyces aberdarensis]|uniref:Protein kinase domain-containing protein n=1 Tax=Candolleomyces aberdarensis TaxID=2316362 RepID=A0A4Q2DSB6_9AGAR|nr:hypothetical protein EST38_g3742 [Candolleomyces aberdarensis]